VHSRECVFLGRVQAGGAGYDRHLLSQLNKNPLYVLVPAGTTFYLYVKQTTALPKPQRVFPLPLRQAISLTSRGNRIELGVEPSFPLGCACVIGGTEGMEPARDDRSRLLPPDQSKLLKITKSLGGTQRHVQTNNPYALILMVNSAREARWARHLRRYSRLVTERRLMVRPSYIHHEQKGYQQPIGGNNAEKRR
jgi:hypothetical protein